MKVLILAGGFGTRISEYSTTIPKPMIPIGGKPILWHLMKHYSVFGYNKFYLALGYKAEIIKEYFLNYHYLNSDFTVDLSTGRTNVHNEVDVDWEVTMVNTGIKTMTGGRIKRLKENIGNETFLLTYGDGLSNININKLVDFHKSHGKMITISAVHPGARFGEIDIDGYQVQSFREKPQTKKGWINGGFFVIEPEFFNLIQDDNTVLEKEPLETAAQKGELMAYCHDDFWHCMDTVRDKENLEKLWASDKPPWIVK